MFSVYDYHDEEGIQTEAYDMKADPYQTEDLVRGDADSKLIHDLRNELSRVQLESGDTPFA